MSKLKKKIIRKAKFFAIGMIVSILFMWIFGYLYWATVIAASMFWLGGTLLSK